MGRGVVGGNSATKRMANNDWRGNLIALDIFIKKIGIVLKLIWARERTATKTREIGNIDFILFF